MPKAPAVTPPFSGKRVREAMRTGLVTCPPDASLARVAGVMASFGVHSVLITDISETEHGWGIVSDRDLLVAAAEGRTDLRARDVARSPVVTIAAKETLARACASLVERGITHLVVTDKARLPVGMLSSLDLVRAMSD